MTDRRPWVRDITLFLHDLFVAQPIEGAGGAQALMQLSKQPPNATINHFSVQAERNQRQARQIALLKEEVGYLRSLLMDNNGDSK